MAKYVCTACGWIYNETVGYQKGGIAPDTRWEDVPAEFTCPVCGADKESFMKQD